MKNQKRVRNDVVAREWGRLTGGEKEFDGELRQVSNWNGNYRVYNDGSVYYYNLLIGEIIDGVHVVYDHTSTGGSFYSRSTSINVNRLKPYAMKIIDYK